MSDFFRIGHDRPNRSKTLRQLALMVHEAEECDDDVTVVECMDEIERRGGNRNSTMSIFMEFYWSEWHKRMKK